MDANRQYKTSVSWVLGDATDVVESFSLALVSALLTDGYGSPMYKGLVETGLGVDWSPNTGYDGSGRLGIFSVGLTGVQEADVSKVPTAIQDILRSVRQKGFERSKIDGYLHQLELGLKHKTANFGLSLLHRLKPKWFTGVDPFDSLAWNDTVAAFEAELAKGGYLEGLVDKYLLNDKTLTFTMAPSATYSQELAAEEEARLASGIADIAERTGGEEQAQKRLEEREQLLLAEQGKSNTEDLSCLPTVHVSDIPREKEPVAVRVEVEDGLRAHWREAPTNGLTYFRAFHQLRIPGELRALIPLFTDAIMRLGTKDTTMEQLEDLIKLKTGGVSVGYHSYTRPRKHTAATEGFMFSGMALDRNVPIMFDLLRKLVVETNFDSPEAVQQIRQLLQASSDGVVNDIASSGHSFARRAAEAGLSPNAYLKEQVGGLSQVKLITTLANRPESDGLEDVITKLKEIQRLALVTGNMRTSITCGSESVQDNWAALTKFIGSLPTRPVDLSQERPQPFSRDTKTFYPLPYQVYYGALALPTVCYASRDSATLQILAQLLTHKHLHHEIREKGGAYGGGAYSRPLDGIFGFYSYRDPNPVNTMNIMRSAGRWAVDKEWADRDLEEAKISVFQGVDAPQSVNEEGMSRFLYSVTDKMRQMRRECLLDVTKDQVREAAQKYIVDALANQDERMVFLGEKQDWVDAGSWRVNEMNVNGSG